MTANYIFLMSNPVITGRLTAAIELIVFVAIALISRRVMDPYFWSYAGPVSLIMTLVILTIYMRIRGQRWSSMGLVPLPSWRAKLMVIPQALLTFVVFGMFVGAVMGVSHLLDLKFMSEMPPGVEDRFGDVRDSLPMLLLWLGIVWTSAAFGEEMFFRGFLVTRTRTLFDGVPLAAVFAVVLPALLFGYGHFYYQGLRGLIMTAAIGIALGAMFLVLKRNLWPLILLHGIIDTIGFLGMYYGWDTA